MKTPMVEESRPRIPEIPADWFRKTPVVEEGIKWAPIASEYFQLEGVARAFREHKLGLPIDHVALGGIERGKVADIVPVAPSTPSPDTATLVCAVIRAVLQLLGGLGIGVGAFGSLPDSSLMIISGILVTSASTAWSLVQKYRAKSRDHMGSVASANRGAPVTPVMTAA